MATAGLVLAMLLLPVDAARAQAPELTVSPSAEAWYRPLPAVPAEVSACDLPTGCPPAAPESPVPAPSQYPAGTLHVGVRAGLEESRTYLTLDLATLPTDQDIAAGVLILPVLTDPASGTIAPETATLRACLVEAFVRDGVDGDASGAPETDCTISSEATYQPATEDSPAEFHVDLAPFADTWSSVRSASLALVPGDAPAPSDTWHASFSRRDREGITDDQRIVAHLALAPSDNAPDLGSDADDFGDPAPPADTGASFAAPPVPTRTLPPLPAPPSPAPDATSKPAPEPVDTTQTTPVAFVVGGRYAYPAVFLLPLLAAAAVAWTGRALTRDLTEVAA